ncbi:AAA-like domain-containing protein [Pseudanabaena yagii]|uniref:CHAT domain-containing protein n=1 Tax=Pseudanabaena yagii GIHE-NHR1 TaxID=2722753 RepID=A0ABX1LQ27_9CYAN|nr:AAA-like domain-containing protein [Pseudanabaena yagii]NMF58220.1 CHAT domain-containing protein [Pseudanabaena yagii GIHE-NHR1]
MTIKKILILAANPLDTDRLRLDKEVEEIRTTLERSPNRDNFAIESRGAVRPQDLQTHLYNLKPQILHFSGHGGGEWGLAFEDEDGGVKGVSTESLTDLFKLFTKQIQCVVLNACYAVVQAEAICQHIPYVIGMNQKIGDQAARKFAEGFYRAIWDDRSIEDAFASGVSAIKLEGIPEELTPVLLKRQPSLPINPKPINSDISVVENNGYFYIVRSRLEQRCYEEVVKAGSLIRIKSPERMGKSTMMRRVLEYAAHQGYRTAVIDLREANREIFADINKFLQWFCAYVGDRLEIDQRPDDTWQIFLGASRNCSRYMNNFFLSPDLPLVIAIDNFDCVFKYSHIADDFCGLLRGWSEKAKDVNDKERWGKLRQIIVHSQDPYALLDINNSPFSGIGLSIEPTELHPSEILALAKSYGLSWTDTDIEQLMGMIGGHPYLIQKAIDEIIHQYIELDELIRTAPTQEGIYSDYLNERLQSLESNPQLKEAMKKVVNSDIPVQLGANDKFKLDSMGLIKPNSNYFVSRCNLYHLYFRNNLR